MFWKTALDTINPRLGLRADEDNRQLKHWKTIIKKAYVEFQANLPGFEPPLIYSLLLAMDGHSEGSKFPNLITPQERERYGL